MSKTYTEVMLIVGVLIAMFYDVIFTDISLEITLTKMMLVNFINTLTVEIFYEVKGWLIYEQE